MNHQEKTIAVAWSLLIAALLLLFALIAAPAAAAQSGTVLRTDPPAISLAPGAETSVALRFEEVEGLYGLEIHLTFDPALVEVVDADPDQAGVQIAAASWWQDGFVAANVADNETGRIDFAATLINPAEPRSGGDTFATITLRGKSGGSGALAIESAILASREAEVIPAELQDAALTVSGAGQSADGAAAADQADGESSGFSLRNNIVLIAVALCGLGAFAIALLVVVGAVIWRRRQGGR